MLRRLRREIVLKAYFAMHGLTEGDGANSLKAYSLVHLGRWAYSFSQVGFVAFCLAAFNTLGGS